MIQSQVPSGCWRATSAVTVPSGRRVDVSANPPAMTGSCWLPSWNLRPLATASAKSVPYRRMALKQPILANVDDRPGFE